jgi:DNA-directed RNA polymerase specialized sigma24 family protein
MNEEEKRRFLAACQADRREAACLEEAIRTWYERAGRMTAVVRLTPGGGDGRRAMEDALARIDELAEKLARCQRRAVDRALAVERAVEAVDDPRGREVLRRRYLLGQTWEEMAEEMHYSAMHLTRLHARALDQLCPKPPEEDVMEC